MFNIIAIVCSWILGFLLGIQFELVDDEENEDEKIAQEEQDKHNRNS